MTMSTSRPAAFVTPLPVLRRARPTCCTLHRQSHSLTRPLLPLPRHAVRISHTLIHPVAVQANPVSGDSDGELQDAAPTKSYSVGLTIVSGFDTKLRRNVIEKIVTQSNAGRIVVVTMGGITSTEERDGVAAPVLAQNQQSDESLSDTDAPSVVSALNGHETADPLPGESNSPSAVNNLEGWISCSSPTEMAEVVVKLAFSRECDYIIAEGSLDNALEPQELAELLVNRCGSSLRIDTLVSVLDGNTLLQDLCALPSERTNNTAPSEEGTSTNNQTEVPSDTIHDSTDTRPMMAVSLVENANVIIVNQSSDDSQTDQLSRVHDIVSVLNSGANIISATEKGLPVSQLVNTNAYNPQSAMLGATWKRVLQANRDAEKSSTRPTLPKSVKDSTFVYRARRPFHPVRLYQHIKAVATFAGVIRSTGKIWLATRMLAPLEWNQAGVSATLRLGKLFWAAIPEHEWPSDDALRERVMRNWDTQYGDRETEMVFVGMGIDKNRLEGLLDGCLLQDEEMVFTNMWENIDDPFVEWVPLIEDDEDEEVTPEPAITTGAEQQPAEAAVAEPEVEQLDPVLHNKVAGNGSDGEGVDVVENSDQQDNETDGEVQHEGALAADEIPDDVSEQLSALDIFEQGFGEDGPIIMDAKDDGAYEEDEAVIASWDGATADDILMQVPKTGLPVTLVTGFLGSGKTTLLNFILGADHGLKIAVLVNEFGDIDIDSQLVETGDWSSGDEVLTLANGCICCSINESFVAAVAKILERADRGEADYLVVETTGVADPVPVIDSLMVSDIAEKVRLDGVLTLVDAENFDPETQMGSEAALSQIMAADTILLSKTDIASKEKVDKTIEYIRSVRPWARILRSQRGRVPIGLILDVGVRVADSPAHINPVKEEKVHDHDHAEASHDHDHAEAVHSHENEHDHDHESEHAHAHDHDHDHDNECGPDCTDESHDHNHNHLTADGFVTTSFKSDRPLDAELFMKSFLQQLPEGVFRAKGLLSFYGYGQRYVFQLSGRRYQFEEDDWPEGVAPGNQLVIIGRELDIDQLRQTLESCLAQ